MVVTPLLQVYSMGYKGRLGIMRNIVNLWSMNIVDDINPVSLLHQYHYLSHINLVLQSIILIPLLYQSYLLLLSLYKGFSTIKTINYSYAYYLYMFNNYLFLSIL